MENYSDTNEYGSIQTEHKDPDEKKSGITKIQKLTLVSVALANLADFTSFSIMAPFFPIEATKMGASDTIIGLIFGGFALVMFISSPILGKFLPQIGAKFMFLSGSFTCGCCAIIFGFLDKLSPGTEFVVFCFVVRSVEALGAAASGTAAFAIIARTFPDNLATTFGVLEIFSGLGFMIGPPLGGYLYSLGGYTLPFAVLGGFTLLIVFFNMLILPSQTDGTKPESGSMMQLLSIPSTLVTGACVLAGSMALSFLDPTLAKHLQKYNLDTTSVGLMFLIISATYTISAFFWGYITDKKNVPKLLMIIGNIGAAAAFLYMGPSPLLMSETSGLWIIILAMVLLGLSIGCSLVPTFHDLITTARWYGMPDNLGTYGVVAGVFSGLFSLGSFVGPTAGGALVGALGFNWASTVFAALYLFAAFGLMLFCLWEYQCGKGRRVPTEKAIVVTSTADVDEVNDERSPLLNV
ncbi:MFS-type transporter SLC18B1-like [Glandiceps talaboti]